MGLFRRPVRAGVAYGWNAGHAVNVPVCSFISAGESHFVHVPCSGWRFPAAAESLVYGHLDFRETPEAYALRNSVLPENGFPESAGNSPSRKRLPVLYQEDFKPSVEYACEQFLPLFPKPSVRLFPLS